ncbi:MAG: hypothetical protein AB1626_04340 [Candidatus Micrarchaeota archaeon]
MRRGQLAVEYIIVMTAVVIVIAFLVIFFKETFVGRMEANIGATAGGFSEYLRAGGVGEPNITVSEQGEESVLSRGVEAVGEAMGKLADFAAEQVYQYRWHLIAAIVLVALGYAAYRVTRSY